MPLLETPPAVLTRLTELGGRPANMYGVLAHSPQILADWIEFAWALRRDFKTEHRLREIITLRVAQVMRCDYQWENHRPLALRVGVREDQIQALDSWARSSEFDARERALLAMTDTILAGSVPTSVADEFGTHFDAAEQVELVLSAAFDTLVARFVDAFQVPLD